MFYGKNEIKKIKDEISEIKTSYSFLRKENENLVSMIREICNHNKFKTYRELTCLESIYNISPGSINYLDEGYRKKCCICGRIESIDKNEYDKLKIKEAEDNLKKLKGGVSMACGSKKTASKKKVKK